MTDIGSLFDDGAEHFERLSPVLWNTMGNAVVAAAGLHTGESVLDVCCGSGASTIPAAQEVGPEGRVDAVDLSAALLDLAGAKAAALGIGNIRFVQADAAVWTSDQPYDALLCGYGMYFLPDMTAGIAHLASQLRSGGKLAMSTWQEQAHQQFGSLLREACFEEQPSLRDAPVPVAYRQMEGIATAGKLRTFLEEAGFVSVEVHETPLHVPLDSELAWTLVLGTGYRFLLPDDPGARERIRSRLLDGLGSEPTLNADSLIAVAVRQ